MCVFRIHYDLKFDSHTLQPNKNNVIKITL